MLKLLLDPLQKELKLTLLIALCQNKSDPCSLVSCFFISVVSNLFSLTTPFTVSKTSLTPQAKTPTIVHALKMYDYKYLNKHQLKAFDFFLLVIHHRLHRPLSSFLSHHRNTGCFFLYFVWISKWVTSIQKKHNDSLLKYISIYAIYFPSVSLSA